MASLKSDPHAILARACLLAAGRLRARKLGSTTLIEAESIDELVKSLPIGRFTTHVKQMAQGGENFGPHHEDDNPSAA